MSRWIDADKIPRHGQRGGIVHCAINADRKTEPTQNQHIQSVESVGADRKTENSSEKPNNSKERSSE